jgi:formylglycine-generating enzyme required for sulfatase activity
LYDLAGNLAEWCFDWDPASVHTAFPSRVVRGGFWKHYAFYCRVGDRYWDRPVYADHDFGFRTILPSGQ